MKKLASMLMMSAILTACASTTHTNEQQAIGMANPASVFCVEQGGTLIPQQDKDGNEYALCRLPNGDMVEEWEYFRANAKQ